MKTMGTVVKEREQKLLEALTYEVVDGEPIYYRGYKDVLEGKKQPEKVMASSALHSKILERLFRLLVKLLPEDKFRICVGEVGVRINDKNVRSLDMAIFYTKDVRDYENLPHYYPVPPLATIEVDIRAEVENDTDYIIQKTNNLLSFGVKKVMWYLNLRGIKGEGFFNGAMRF